MNNEKNTKYDLQLNLESMLSLWKWQAKVFFQNHDTEAEAESPFTKSFEATTESILEMAGVPDNGELVTFRNGLNGNFTFDQLNAVFTEYRKDTLSRSEVKTLLINWDSEKPYQRIFDDKRIKQWFPEMPTKKEEPNEPMKFGNSVMFGSNEVIVYVRNKKGQICEVVFDEWCIGDVIQRYYRLKTVKNGGYEYVEGVLRPQYQVNGRGSEIVARFVTNVEDYENVTYKNMNRFDLRLANLKVYETNRPSKIDYSQKVVDLDGMKAYVKKIKR